MREMLKKFIRDEEGQDFVEYALLIGGIAMTLTVAIGGLSDAIVGGYNAIAAFVTDATT